jgi:predicted cupin superfamily sugar epimerase
MARNWIKHLNLQPHPEGGYYREVFRSTKSITREGETTVRPALTSIYYLLEARDFSGFHRLASDEIWYFHAGSPLHIHVIANNGQHTLIELSDSATGNLQAVIPANTWFAAELPTYLGFTLASCAVAPGFDFAEFEMARREEMIAEFPQHEGLLGRLCR